MTCSAVKQMNNLLSLLGDYTFQVVAVGSCALGIISGISGSFATLRQQSLLGDSISHSALAGVAIAFILTGSKTTEVLLIGAGIVGLIATYLITQLSRFSKANFESVMAVVMSSFFGLGLMLLTYIQHLPNANQAGLNRFLFGQAATMLSTDVLLILIVAVLIILTVCLFFKEFKLFVFDRDFASDLGLPTGLLNFILSTMVVLTVILGIQSVGVVLMSALLISPAIAARQWTHHLSSLIGLAAILGGISGLGGTLISSSITNFPTGPAIVLIISLILIVSLLIAPGRGIIWQRQQLHRAKLNVAADMILLHLLEVHKSTFSAADFAAIHASQAPLYSMDQLVKNLQERHSIEKQESLFIVQESAIQELSGHLKKEEPDNA